jgi:hypothetical protein
LFVFLALALSFSIFLAACSDNSSENNLTEGDPQDPNFQTAQMVTEGIVDTLLLEADLASGFINFDGSQPMSPTAESLLITFDETTCWWHIYVSSDTNNASLLFIDSLKFQDAGGCQQFPDSLTTTEIEYRAYLDISIITDSAYIAGSANDNLLLQGIQEDTCAINAGLNRNLEMALSQYEYSYNCAGAIDNVKFLTQELMYGENPRPVSGTLILNLTIYGASQQGSVGVHWFVTVTFNETGYHVRAESGENFWEWDVTYIT